MRTILTLALLVSGPAHAFEWSWNTSVAQPADFDATMQDLDAADTGITAWTIDRNGEWLIVDENEQMHYSDGFSDDILYGVLLTLWYGGEVEALDCTSGGTCLLVHSAGYSADGPLPAGVADKIDLMHSKGWAVREAEITDSGYVLLGPGSVAYYSGIDSTMAEVLYDRHRTGRTVQHAQIGLNGRWLVISDQNPASEGLSTTEANWARTAAENAWAIDAVLLGRAGELVMYDPADAWITPDLTDPSVAVEYDLRWGRNIWERMDDYGIPGVSIAIIEDNQVVSARGYGTRAFGFQMPVLGNTPFDLASLSKYPAALTTLNALRYEEEVDQFGLDTNVMANIYPGGAVEEWKARGEDPNDPWEGPYDPMPSLQAMTFRQLMSHTAGLRSKGTTPVDNYAYGSSAGLEEWMTGYDYSVENAYYYDPNQWVWADPLLNPGERYQYSNSGFMLTQATLVDHTGQSAGSLMREHLFGPLGLENTSGYYPPSSSVNSRRSWQHDGTAYKTTYYPWTFGGGVWSSSEDYAEMVIVGMNQGKSSSGVQVVAVADVAMLLTANTTTLDGTVTYGLGVGFDNVSGAGEGTGEVFFHSGGHTGRASTYFCGRPSDDDGIVILINTEFDGVGDFRNEILDAYTAAKGWNENCR